jgi:hypothetical protein
VCCSLDTRKGGPGVVWTGLWSLLGLYASHQLSTFCSWPLAELRGDIGPERSHSLLHGLLLHIDTHYSGGALHSHTGSRQMCACPLAPLNVVALGRYTYVGHVLDDKTAVKGVRQNDWFMRDGFQGQSK